VPHRSWGDLADEILGPLFGAMAPGTSESEIRRQVREAYPFGERKYWPYKAWIARVRAWRHAWRLGYRQPIRRRVQPVRTRIDRRDSDTLPLGL
jgi:hypothetical protein